MSRIRQSVIDHRRKVVPGVLAFALAAGFAVSIIGTPNAQADYFTGCGYGYNASAGGFGTGTGAAFQYGYLKNGTFGYGYGNEVCPLAVTTTALTGGIVGKSYSVVLAGTGGVSPYTWTESGALPAGLTLSTSGTISGSPTAAGTFPFVATMTDVNGQTKTANLSITTVKVVTKPKFHATKVHVSAIVGRSVTLTITGVGFYGRPRVTSNERGTKIVVLHDRGTQLVIRVRVPAHSRKGWHTFTIRLANGSVSRINYLVR